MKNIIIVFTVLLAISSAIFMGKTVANRQVAATPVFVHNAPERDFPTAQPLQKNALRPDITFIVGEDKDSDNPFYTQAENYYRTHPEAKTEWLITHLRSLKEVRDYLTEHARGKWGIINIVVHSNEWTGMSVSVLPEGARATAMSIYDAIDEGHFQPLPDSIVDHRTELHLHACALGKNEDLLDAISVAFGGESAGSPRVRSSKRFIQYITTEAGTERYLSEYWHTYFKTGYRPHDINLTKQLEKKYPDAPVYFYDALKRTQPRFAGDSYHYFFNVPVNWTVTFPTEADRPKLDTDEAKEAFLYHQIELLEMVGELNIPIENFRWQYKYIEHTFEDGTTEPAILIKGKSSVLCVLKSLTAPSPHNPKHPLPSEDGKQTSSL